MDPIDYIDYKGRVIFGIDAINEKIKEYEERNSCSYGKLDWEYIERSDSLQVKIMFKSTHPQYKTWTEFPKILQFTSSTNSVWKKLTFFSLIYDTLLHVMNNPTTTLLDAPALCDVLVILKNQSLL